MVCGSAGASPSQAIFNKAKALLLDAMALLFDCGEPMIDHQPL
ncbi:MAG TPA: hypothetical protein VNQ76_03210 [Planctomicrobium sp.]|nr:hypothetical protein [Planctomicrobium sp.]